MSDHPDCLLLRRVREGDAAAAAAFVDRLCGPVERMVFRLTGWPGDIQDLVQEVFLNVQTESIHFRGESSLETWVLGITIRVCRRYHRTVTRRVRREQSVARSELAPEAEGTDRLEDKEWVQWGLRQLPQQDREILVLRYLEEMSPSRIVELLNLTRSAVDVRLHRARKKLEDLLKNQEFPV